MEPTADWGAALIVGLFILGAGIACLVVRVRQQWADATRFIEDTRRDLNGAKHSDRWSR